MSLWMIGGKEEISDDVWWELMKQVIVESDTAEEAIEKVEELGVEAEEL